MTALAADRTIREERWTYKEFPLGAAVKAYKGGLAAIDTTTGYCVQGQASTSLVFLGSFAEQVDNTSGGAGAKNVTVNFHKEKCVRWYANGGDIVAADLLQNAYILDDQTVVLASAGHSVAGKILAVDAIKGVAVEVV